MQVVIPTVVVPAHLKMKWEASMASTRGRTANITIYGRRHLMREDVEEGVFKHCAKEEIESLYTTTSPKTYFVVFKEQDKYEEFLKKIVHIQGANIKPLPYDSLDVEA